MPWPWLFFLLQLSSGAADGGRLAAARAPSPDAGAALSPEDAEVVQNLELLEQLDAAKDLDLLQELSVEN